MERSISRELLERVAQTEPIARKLDQIEKQRAPVKFSHVIAPAQAFLSAVIARHAQKTVWMLCPSVRAQDSVYETILNWLPNAQFLPEAEFAAVENVLPDPEIAAERLALLAKIDSESGPHVIVTTRASLDQPAPKRGAVSSATLQIKRGTATTMEQLLEKLSGAGYDRVAQVTTRGQFAVRGGIVDLYSWQAPLPIRLEFFGDNVESLREFDIDTQTSVRDLSSRSSPKKNRKRKFQSVKAGLKADPRTSAVRFRIAISANSRSAIFYWRKRSATNSLSA